MSVIAVPDLVRRAASSMHDPLLRNGYALLANTVVSAVLGLVYWIVAARLYDPGDVGAAAAAITTMSLLASLAGMNLSGALSFLLPQVGSSAKAYITRSYGASTAFAILLVVPLVVVALAGEGFPGAPGLDRLDLLLLAAAVPAWTIFTLQDGVLTGLRRATWVLVENTLFGVAKLALLLVVGVLGIAGGIFMTWLLPLAVAVVVVNALLFARVLPHVGRRQDRLSLGPREVGRFVGQNYAASLFYQGYFNLLPVLVLVQVGDTASGLFYVAWTLASSLDLLSHSLAASLTVEGATRPERLAAITAQVLKRVMAIVVSTAVVVLLGAPLILSVYGPDYAEASSAVLRLLVLGAVPRTVLIVAQAVARARGDAHMVLWSEIGTCALVLGLSVALLPSLGPVAVGVAWLVGNAVVLALVAGPCLRLLRVQQQVDEPSAAADPA